MHEPEDAESGSLAALAEELARLRDLFQRRLLEDKAKNILYEQLREQLALARGGLAEQALTPLCHELLLVLDRIHRLNATGDVVLDSIAEELHEVLARRDVRPVATRERFDPAYHEVVRIDHLDDCPADEITEVVRPGYMLGSRLLRPERVALAGPAPIASPAAVVRSADPETPDRTIASKHHENPLSP